MINIYCDESCHLENDNINVMILGGIICPQDKLKEANKDLKEIKNSFGIPANLELKWTKVSPAKIDLYKALIYYFFDNKHLKFRGLVIPDKSQLDHERFNQTHDDWYYKMYYVMLKAILLDAKEYQIYIDIKDTNSYRKSQELKKYLSILSKNSIKKLHPIRSDEIQIMQLADLFIGAVGYCNRDFPKNHIKSIAKQEIIQLIQNRSKCSLTQTTYDEKFNMLMWTPQGNGGQQ